jgi:hypothetical protein
VRGHGRLAVQGLVDAVAVAALGDGSGQFCADAGEHAGLTEDERHRARPVRRLTRGGGQERQLGLTFEDPPVHSPIPYTGLHEHHRYTSEVPGVES